ncbi:unnamed protein product [Cylindrotheca closterium]|uniref:Uncharacterized protein n=1 Tax=Cylindrotheca closterium TaxID=2856 RepID=A0AAD2FSF6_9STRA|nr:unnamed protein product [Cylindrotheca closterium]
MTITGFAERKKSYSYLTTQASCPNHDSTAVLDAFDPTQDLQLQDLNSLFKEVPQHDITDKDPATVYELLVTHKQMPILKEFLDITWDRSSACEVLQLVVDRIKVLADSDEPKKISEVMEKSRHFVDHWCVTNMVIRRHQLLKNIGEPTVLIATLGRR